MGQATNLAKNMSPPDEAAVDQIFAELSGRAHLPARSAAAGAEPPGTPLETAAGYNQRGVNYTRRGHYDLAIADSRGPRSSIRIQQKF